ncbi:DMT family transporter [Jannaschia seohaensis]|nr:DMT family transporter [Jannaschia seohaensis]
MSGSGVVEARPVLGAVAILANTILVPIIGVAVKMLAELGVGPLELLAGRGWLTFLLLLPFLALGANRRAVLRADLKAHAIHAAFAVTTMACFYYALRTLPLVTVTAINFTSPALTVLLAGLLFGDRVRPLGWAALILGFIGTLLVLRPGVEEIGLDMVVVLIGSILAAGMNLAVRRIPARSSNYAVLFYFSLAGAVIYGAIGASSVTVPTPTEALWFLVLAATAILVHGCIALAYRVSSTVLVGGLDYGRIVGAALLGYVLFAEVPTLLDSVGIALIVLSGAIVLRVSTTRVPAKSPA